MKKLILYSTFVMNPLLYGMENPPASNAITRDELLAFIKARDTRNVHTALQHLQAATVIDKEVIEQAEAEHKNYMQTKQLHESTKLSKTWSIVHMLTKAVTEKIPKKEKNSSKKSSKSHSHSVRISRSEYVNSPKLRLAQLIRNGDVPNLSLFIRNNGDRFIDVKALKLAKNMVNKKDHSSTKELLVLDLLQAHAPREVKSKIRHI